MVRPRVLRLLPFGHGPGAHGEGRLAPRSMGLVPFTNKVGLLDGGFLLRSVSKLSFELQCNRRDGSGDADDPGGENVSALESETLGWLTGYKQISSFSFGLLVNMRLGDATDNYQWMGTL